MYLKNDFVSFDENKLTASKKIVIFSYRRHFSYSILEITKYICILLLDVFSTIEKKQKLTKKIPACGDSTDSWGSYMIFTIYQLTVAPQNGETDESLTLCLIVYIHDAIFC